MDDLHPYDNVERRFRHTDEPVMGRGIVARMLGLPQPPTGEMLFDLSFYSGGIGVLDLCAITVPADPALWSTVTRARRVQTPEEAERDASWLNDLVWLFTSDKIVVPLRPAAVGFINEYRKEFQLECTLSCRILIEHRSDVNDWMLLWGDDTRLSYLGYSQG